MKTLIKCLFALVCVQMVGYLYNYYSQGGKVDVYDIKTMILVKLGPSGIKVLKSPEGDW